VAKEGALSKDNFWVVLSPPNHPVDNAVEKTGGNFPLTPIISHDNPKKDV
jgi:hypothetical protein